MLWSQTRSPCCSQVQRGADRLAAPRGAARAEAGALARAADPAEAANPAGFAERGAAVPRASGGHWVLCESEFHSVFGAVIRKLSRNPRAFTWPKV